MRVSVMLHLPALARLGLLPKIIDEATSFGLSVRGLYGENTSGYGHIYQVSNRQTLGLSDDEIINKIKAIVGTIISQERKARNVYVATTFAFFTEGLEKFNRFYEDGIISRVYSTNLTYISDELKSAKWYKPVDMSELVAKIINKLNYDKSIASYMDATRVIRDLLEE